MRVPIRANPSTGRLCVALILFSCWPAVAGSEFPTGAFESANKLYYEGKFSEAAAAYERLAQSNRLSAALCFNLGNAFFKSSQIGRAIAAYRQAERITPRDPDVRANLQFARNQVQGPTFTPSRWQRWVGRLTLNEWTLLTTGALWLWLLLLAALQWRPALRKPMRSYLVALALGTLFLGLCLADALRQARPGRNAIVFTRDTPVRRGPLEEAEHAFMVHDGAELEVLDQNEQWLQVATDSRRLGWVRRDQVLLAPRG